MQANSTKRIRRVATHAVLICGSIAFLFPLAWMISTSLKPLDQTMVMPPQWIPRPVQINNYVKAVQYIPFFRYAMNTLTVCILSTTGMVLSSALVAYGFARVDWKGRDALFFLALATMMVPFQVTMVPLYGIFRSLNWIGTFRPLWVPSWFGAAFNIFLLRQFFLTIPRDLSDAAFIDGCSDFAIFRRIILPLSKPALAVVTLFHFMYHWNDFMGPLIYLTDQKSFTLALGLQSYQSQHGETWWNMLMAASALVILPIIVLFFFTQKTFIEGITMTGLKG
jgi:multiple sugar transport system permease protein